MKLMPCLLAALLPALAMPVPASPPGLLKVSGQVVDEQGQPLAKAVVLLQSMETAQGRVRVETDAEGRYSAALPKGHFAAIFFHPQGACRLTQLPIMGEGEVKLDAVLCEESANPQE